MVPINSYLTVSEHATLYEAIKVLKSSFHRDGRAWYGHRSAIVLDASGNLVGVLTLRGLLRAAGLREMDKDPYFKAESWSWYYVKRLREEAKIRVRDVMRPLAVVTVDAKDDVSSVAASLLKHNVNSLPVLSQGKLVGMIRTVDIFMVVEDYFM